MRPRRYEPRRLPQVAEGALPWGAWSPDRRAWWCYLGTHPLVGQPMRFGSAEAVYAWASRQSGGRSGSNSEG